MQTFSDNNLASLDFPTAIPVAAEIHGGAARNRRRLALSPVPGIRRGFLFLVSLLAAVSVFGLEYPAWILLEKGKASFAQKRLSEALDYLLDSVELQEEYPEAEFWLGKVYEAQGQIILAEAQYRRAIELAIYLRVPQELVLIRYRLAKLLLNQGQERALEAESILYGIADSKGASSRPGILLEHQYIDRLTENGIDELLFLYRDDLGYALEARKLLGEIAWRRGNYRSALLHSMRAALSILTTTAERYRAIHLDWRFDIDPIRDAQSPDKDVRFPGASDGTDRLIMLAYEGDESLAAWMESAGLWPVLYLLSVSLYAEGFEEVAASIWELMVVRDSLDESYHPRIQSGYWGELAKEQLEEPFISIGSLSP